MNPVVEVAIALVWQHGRLLVTQRPVGSHLAGRWEFPGGKLEPGETPEACAVREVLEEVGLHIAPRSRRQTIRHDYTERSVQLYPIDCDLLGGVLQLLEVSQAQWVRPSELATLAFPEANRELVAELAATRDA